MTLSTYVAARMALARLWIDTGDRRYLWAYRDLKLEMLRERHAEIVMPMLLRKQA